MIVIHTHGCDCAILAHILCTSWHCHMCCGLRIDIDDFDHNVEVHHDSCTTADARIDESRSR